MQLTGIHHLTAISAAAPGNKKFYTETMGMRMVKKTVNQDDTSAYHLFYADALARPGTDLTFFDWPAPPEQRGTHHLLFPAIMVFCAIGVFSISNMVFDVHLMALFGLLGYVFHKLGCEPTPLLLGFPLGPPMEEFLRRALVLSEGDPAVLVREPLSAALLLMAALLLATVLSP